jgi:hypothetical protein
MDNKWRLSNSQHCRTTCAANVSTQKETPYHDHVLIQAPVRKYDK